MMVLESRFQLSFSRFSLDAALHAPNNGITALFGRSGAGKTTILRCLAGLTRAAKGYLRVGDECWQDDTDGIFVPVHKRHLGYVFQEARLFPHLNVHDNLLYGWKRLLKWERKPHLEQVISLLGIAPLLTRYPQNLSGGEEQRVAIARALLTKPRLLLMDEPLASLDFKSKSDIIPYLEKLKEELKIPILYVSHSLDEVMRLADNMILLEQGKVIASGTLNQVLPHLNIKLAEGEDANCFIEGQVDDYEPDFQLIKVVFAGSHLFVPESKILDKGKLVRLRIRAEDVSIALSKPAATSILNVLPAVISSMKELSPQQVLICLECQGSSLLAKITRKSVVALGLKPAHKVYAQIKAVKLCLFFNESMGQTDAWQHS